MNTQFLKLVKIKRIKLFVLLIFSLTLFIAFIMSCLAINSLDGLMLFNTLIFLTLTGLPLVCMLGILDTKEFEELLNIYKQIQSEFYNKEKGILFLKYMEQRNLSEAYGVLKAWRL